MWYKKSSEVFFFPSITIELNSSRYFFSHSRALCQSLYTTDIKGKVTKTAFFMRIFDKAKKKDFDFFLTATPDNNQNVKV